MYGNTRKQINLMYEINTRQIRPLRPIHMEQKRKRNGKFSFMYAEYALIFFFVLWSFSLLLSFSLDVNGPLERRRICCIYFTTFTQLSHWFVEHHVGSMSMAPLCCLKNGIMLSHCQSVEDLETWLRGWGGMGVGRCQQTWKQESPPAWNTRGTPPAS